MKKIEQVFIFLSLALMQGRLAAQTAEADSMDVLHYNLVLDLGNMVERHSRDYLCADEGVQRSQFRPDL